MSCWIFAQFPDMGFPSYMSQTIEELRIGTYENVAMVVKERYFCIYIYTANFLL